VKEFDFPKLALRVLPTREKPLHSLHAAGDLGGVIALVPEARARHLSLKLGDLSFERIAVKGAHRSWPDRVAGFPVAPLASSSLSIRIETLTTSFIDGRSLFLKPRVPWPLACRPVRPRQDSPLLLASLFSRIQTRDVAIHGGPRSAKIGPIGGDTVNGYFAMLAAVPGFFLSSLFVMLMSRAIGPRLGFATFSYPDAMLVTIALWLAVAPLAAAGRGRRCCP
jgi:hypothetical protein